MIIDSAIETSPNIYGKQKIISSQYSSLYPSKGKLTLKRSLGWALEQAFSGNGGGKGKLRIRPDEDKCVHHHTNKGNFVGKGSGMVQQR